MTIFEKWSENAIGLSGLKKNLISDYNPKIGISGFWMLSTGSSRLWYEPLIERSQCKNHNSEQVHELRFEPVSNDY